MSYIDALISWNDLTLKSIIIFLLIMIVGTCILFSGIANPTGESIGKSLNIACLKKCDHNLCTYLTKNFRDSSYLLGQKEQPLDCIFSFWELTHLVLYIFIGYFFNIYIAFIWGIIFEMYEHNYYDCGSTLDIFWNMLGFMIGTYIRYVRFG
jgi:hypothetical protein